jgi:hypothetical protein
MGPQFFIEPEVAAFVKKVEVLITEKRDVVGYPVPEVISFHIIHFFCFHSPSLCPCAFIPLFLGKIS